MTFSEQTTNHLHTVAKALVAPGKGILAADESTPTIKKRFDSIQVESTDATRRDYRELLFKAPGSSEYISGVIMYDETIRAKSRSGAPLVDMLKEAGIIPGIKVDMGAKDLNEFSNEKYTLGLDTLRERLKEYKKIGAEFAKWRAVINIDMAKNYPSEGCITANAVALARYAYLCQEAAIVPIVEPEIIMDGSHSIDDCLMVTKKVLHAVFHQLSLQSVDLKGILLKPNMVIDGSENRVSNAQTIAKKTIECFLEHVPAAVPGIVFLSGGQSEQEATAHLNEMNKMYQDLPWELSFSYGRALQASTLQTWRGSDDNWQAATEAYLHRAKLNSAARYGKYAAAMENG